MLILGASPNLLWNVDGSGDIGASGANRPDNIFAKISITAGAAITAGTTFRSSAGALDSTAYGFTGFVDTGMYLASTSPDILCFVTEGVVKVSIGGINNVSLVADYDLNLSGTATITSGSGGLVVEGTVLTDDSLTATGTLDIHPTVATTVGDGGSTNYINITATGNIKHFGSSKFSNLTWDIETFTSDDTLDAGNVVVLLDGSSNTVTASLPTASGITGRVYILKSIDASFTTDVNPSGSETIDGDSSNFSLVEDETITIISDGTNWHIL